MITARRVAGWSVHFYTALGAVAAVFALLAIARGEIGLAMLLLALAVAIDASDGALARLARVKEVVPEYDGAKLDDIVDYLTFVVVPIYLMLETGMLVGVFGYAAGAAAVLASAYRFCHEDAKTSDHFFTGFPSYWNIIAYYFYVFETSPGWSAFWTGVLAVLVFAPLRFVYPTRTVFLRPWTIGLGLIWGAMTLMTLAALPERRTTLAAVSLFYPAYYTLLSFYMQWRGYGSSGPPKAEATR
ncbi:MAG: CDP-diacylglycerol O-phosphatidyltransferase [Deltaproteobacteria bacterium]|nr:CDP-diacylglycerol O-phosphatidyltransferase [Deltaproteobacteria bacterium]